MSIINIGNNGYIEYSVSNPTCYDATDGLIDITTIIFDNLYSNFISYSITWESTTALDPNQIRDNGASLINLSAGTYSFTIVGSTTLGPYNILVESPDKFAIKKIDAFKYSCGDNGIIFVEVSGGTPPYTFNNSELSVQQNDTSYTFHGLSQGFYTITVTDYNRCEAINDTDIVTGIEIMDSTISLTSDEVLPPEILDSFGYLKLSVQGFGPFGFSFVGPSNINFDKFDTSNLLSYDQTDNIYTYHFINQLLPGSYSVTITNNLNCSITETIDIPNLLPITTAINVVSDTPNNQFLVQNMLPIFDTIFIPYHHIQQNSETWQIIQRILEKNKISLKIDGVIVQQMIIRKFLSSYCIDDTIEVVRLDNNKENWYFAFHIGPGINLLTQQIPQSISIIDMENNTEYECILGLDSDQKISSEKPSLLIGSSIITGINNTYFSGSDAYITISSSTPTGYSEEDSYIKDIKIASYFNLYNLGFVTAVYFLENFNVLTSNLNINQTACSIDNNDYQYILNIKKLLLDINNINNYNSLYIYNKTLNTHSGSISVFANANPTITKDLQLVDNSYSIDFFAIDNTSDNLSVFIKNNQQLSGENLQNIPFGYIITRIKDINNNITRYIYTNNTTISYDRHFTEAKNFLQKYNYKIKDKFQYGDILCYVRLSTDTQTIVPDLIPSSTIIQSSTTTQTITPTPTNITTSTSNKTIKQSGDSTNTSTIVINLVLTDCICYLLGPKNYKQRFIGSTTFENVVPGVYTIIGDEDYLSSKLLYQQSTRIIVDKNQIYDLSINFQSYGDKTFIRTV